MTSCPRGRSAVSQSPACEPTNSLSVTSTVQVTLGRSFGRRPYTSRDMSSTISGRRCFHHISGVVTFWPFFRVSASGRFGYGFAVGLVVIGVVGVAFVAARPGAKGFDAELVHHVLMILLRSECDGRGGGTCLRDGECSWETEDGDENGEGAKAAKQLGSEHDISRELDLLLTQTKNILVHFPQIIPQKPSFRQARHGNRRVTY